MDHQFFYRGDNIVESVRPFQQRRSRVCWKYFTDHQSAKSWMAKRGADKTGLLRQREVILKMPDAILNVERKRSSFVAGPKRVKVRGITNSLSTMFGNMFSKSWKGKHYTRPLKDTRKMQSLGMSVDKELKLFATGHLTYKAIQHPETRSILHHLANRGISLISSGVLVSNYTCDSVHPRHSGTEIDLVGFDHKKQCIVVIEIKVTGKRIDYLKQKNKDAPLVNKTCGFKRSEMGKYAAQLACTSVMYTNTYKDHIFYPLLVIYETDTPHCESFKLDGSLVDSSRFSQIDGF